MARGPHDDGPPAPPEVAAAGTPKPSRPRGLVDGGEAPEDIDAGVREGVNLRPQRMADYIGQSALKRKLAVFVQAARQRSEPLDHTLLHGPPGLGKTTMAQILANELEVQIHLTSGPAIEHKGVLAGHLTALEPGDVLFIDEIHRLSATVEESLYSAMEDGRIDLPVGEGSRARTMPFELAPFTLIGATTRTALLSAPLRERFQIVEGIDFYTDEQLQKVASEAVDRTMMLFEAQQPPAGELPVVLDAGASGILLHEAVGHGMEADFNRKNISIYADMIGKKVAPDFVTIIDDGTIEHERGALNVDDEGQPTERTVLVDHGVLASFLHDRMSAQHYGMARSTGSGRRQSFRHAPLPRMRCTTMLDGPHTRDEIIASVDKGILAQTFTNGQVQIGAGDFTFYIKNGWLIEGGKITAPIRDCNIIGNGPDALKQVTMAAADSKLDSGGWTCGKDGQGVPVSQGLPTVKVAKMTVGGKHA